MIRADQIPDEVMDAFYYSLSCDEWDRKAIAAALSEWPDMVEQFFPNSPLRPPGIFLPLPQEVSDE